jgi:Protein of unknown function (DUF2510)
MADRGWYPDPDGTTDRQRYFDGSIWTDQTHVGNQQWASPGAQQVIAPPTAQQTMAAPPPGYVLTKKKRHILRWLFLSFVLLIALIIIVAVASSGGTKTANVGSGTSAHPAIKDVAITSCHNEIIDAALANSGIATAMGTVANHSSETSDYTVQIAFFDHAGTRVATGAALETAVPAGGSALFTSQGDQDLSDHDSLTCKLIEVTRLATAAGQT